MSFENEYRELMEKPIEEIREDIFFRPDNFQHELWYGDFQMYMTVGICQPPEEHALQVRKALKVMGYDTHTAASMVWSYIGEITFNMLILVGSVKMSDHVVREMMGL